MSDSINKSTLTLLGTDLSLLEKIDALPTKPGVYQFKNTDGKIIYVGKAQNLRNRVRQYFQKSRSVDLRIDAMVSKIVDVELLLRIVKLKRLFSKQILLNNSSPVTMYC